MGNLLYPPLNFAVNLKTTPKNQALKKKKTCLTPHFLFLISYLDLPSYLTTHHVLIGKCNLFQDYPL